MAGWQVTEQAVSTLDGFAGRLRNTEGEMNRERSRLSREYDACGSGLGPHSGEIKTLLDEADSIGQEADKLIDRLALKLARAAMIRGNALDSGRYRGSASSTVGTKEKFRADDSGAPYSKKNPETGEYAPVPNSEYKLNDYEYRTDAKGNIVQVYGLLKDKGRRGRKVINDSVPGMKPGDERGHLIGDQFDGSNQNGNLVAMGFDVNRSEYKRLEERWAAARSEGKDVIVSIHVSYDGESKRPTRFTVEYLTDDETDVCVFHND